MDEHTHFVLSKVSRAMDSLAMPRSYCYRTSSVKCIVWSLKRSSTTAAQSGGGKGLHVGRPGCRCCKNFKPGRYRLPISPCFKPRSWNRPFSDIFVQFYTRVHASFYKVALELRLHSKILALNPHSSLHIQKFCKL